MNNKNIDSFKSEDMKLFYPGFSGSDGYRIPSLLALKNGTLIAGIDQRVTDSEDSPNNINAFIRTSTDNGETWNSGKVILDYPGTKLDAASVIDMLLLEDKRNERVFILIDQFRGGIGAPQSDAGTGMSEDGRNVLYDLKKWFRQGKPMIYPKYTMEATEKTGWYNLYDMREESMSEYSVDNSYCSETGKVSGRIYKNGIDTGSTIYDHIKNDTESEVQIVRPRTSFLQIMHSDDSGKTWSAPRDINYQIKESWMRFMGTGPGVGIQLKNQSNPMKQGRLVYPVYFTNEHGLQSCALVYSDDCGVNWKRGTSPNDGRIYNGRKINSKDIFEQGAEITESQVIELNDGRVCLYMRNRAKNKSVAMATSYDGGETWINPTTGEVDFVHHLEIPDTYCQLSVVKYPCKEKDIVVLSNASGNENRENRIIGTLSLSEDGGKTWRRKQFTKEGYAYSSMTILNDGNVGLLYENDKYEKINGVMHGCEIIFTKFNLEFIKSN